jgi:hypothetical protein
MPKKAIKITLGFFILLAALPLLQVVFNPFKLVGLSGAFEVNFPPKFSFNNLLNGKFQQHSDLYIKDNAPFKGDLVRFRNQLNYFAFNEINTNLMLGKEHFIFDPNYLLALEGKDLHTDSLYNANALTLENGIRNLANLKIPLFVVFTPNKADFYKDKLILEPTFVLQTNAKRYADLLLKNKVPFFDANAWFLKLKDTSSFTLIPKYGAHWSSYGAWLAADSLTKLFQMNGISTPKVISQKIELSQTARFTDDDYLPSLNLIWKWASPQLAYPILGFEPSAKPDVLVVSDSYFWNFYDLGYMEHVFGPQSQLWYYNKTKYNFKRDKLGECSEVLNPSELKQFKAIIFMSAHPSLNNFSFGFFNQLNASLNE